MDIVRIDRDEAPAIEVPARLLLETDRHTELMQGGERGFQLFLYRTADGYIVGIRVLSSCAHEHSHQIVEVVETTNDVENFLFVYEPGEHLSNSTMESLTSNERDELITRLLEMYDRQVEQILDVLRSDSESAEKATISCADQPPSNAARP